MLKEAERLAEKLRGEGKEVDTYICGRKGEAYYRFRSRPVVQSWTGFSDQPSYEVAHEIGRALIDAFLEERGRGGRVDEVHVVYTRFRSMLIQEPTAMRLLPLEVVEGEEKPGRGRGAAALRVRAVAPRPSSTGCCRSTSRAGSSSRCCRRPPPSSPPARRR